MAGRGGGDARCKAGEGGLSFFAPAAPTDMLASGRMETDNGDVTVTSKAVCYPLSQSMKVCQLVEYGCDQVQDHCLSHDANIDATVTILDGETILLKLSTARARCL